MGHLYYAVTLKIYRGVTDGEEKTHENVRFAR